MNMILILSGLLIAVLVYGIIELTRAQQLKAEAAQIASMMTMKQIDTELRSIFVAVWLCFAGGVLLTGAFAVQFFSGTDDVMNFSQSELIYAGIGIIATLAITSVQYILYGSIDGSRAGLVITMLILCFVIFSEIATSSERTDLLVKHRSAESEAFKGAVSAINQPTAPANVNMAGLAEAEAELADAEYELGRCDRHASRGQQRVERCQVYEQKRIEQAKGKIRAIQNQNAFMASQSLENKKAMIELTKALEYDEEKSPAIVKFLKTTLGGDLLQAMILASLIFVVAFESGFHFAGTKRAVYRYAKLLKQNHNNPKADDHEKFMPTGGVNVGYGGGSFGAGFTKPKKPAPAAQYTQASKQNLGFVNTNGRAPDKATQASKNSTLLGTAEEQLAMPELSTWSRELSGHGVHCPDDNALDKPEDQATIQRIIDRGLQAGKATTPGTGSWSEKATTPGTETAPQKAGAPGTEKRVLPVSEAQPTKAGAPGLDAELLAAMKSAMQDVPTDVLREAGAVYPVWRGQVAKREIKPSKRDGFKFVSAQLCRGKKRTLTPASMVKLLSIWQLRAVSDGVLRLNPNQRSGAAKYLLT